MKENTVMKLSPEQGESIRSISIKLSEIAGVRAVVLGGSYARGVARPGSDIDLGILYSERDPFSIQKVRELVEAVNDTPGPVVAGFYEWGPWVNGGAWLTIDGQRIDFIYRSLEHIERIIADAEAGRYEVSYEQQPPFGFFSGTYLGEVAICIPLFDPEGRLDQLKQRVAVYPELLRQSVIRDNLWSGEFGIEAFARKYAARGDSYGTAACLSRVINNMVMALFAINRKYLINDKTALLEIDDFGRAPVEFKARAQSLFGSLGTSAVELTSAVDEVEQLLKESIALGEGIYQSRYSLPK